MKEVVNFVDTTMRDGAQSNWASGMPAGMMKEILEDIDNAGYAYIDAPYVAVNFKKYTRDLREDIWEMVRMFGKTKTKKGIMSEPGIDPWDMWDTPRAMTELFLSLLVNYGALQRVQLMGNVYGTDSYGWFVPMIKKLGLEINFGVCYYISPRHQSEGYFEEKTKMMAAYEPTSMYIKDAGGLLEIDSIREVLPIVQEHSKGLPLELHSHCTTGMADAVYVEAMKMGCRTFHVAIPPMAEGTAQPSVFNTVDNCKHLGLKTNLDMERIQRVSERIYTMAKQVGPEDAMRAVGTYPLPTHFGPTRYNLYLYKHKIPGGVISNTVHQLKELKLTGRMDEVAEECITICEETGYPHMITPYSQFVCTQAALNVATGERYKVVIDEMIKVALGCFSADSGYLEMDQNLKDKFLSLPRAKELQRDFDHSKNVIQHLSVKDVRKQLDAVHLSDEEFMLRYLMKGQDEIDTMYRTIEERGSKFMKFSAHDMPILELIDKLSQQPKVTNFQIKGPKGTFELRKQK
ncbi:MAG: hypothetical protein GX996_02060 [Firmicutes bacterium]|nr:hypothetical protein [Bacillota bacterium]